MGIFSRTKLSPAEQAQRAFDEGRFADAVSLFRQAAAVGDAHVPLRVAQLYERGQGIPQSFVDAVLWYRIAAERGSVAAQARLGEILLTGLEPPDTAAASAIAKIDAPDANASLIKRLFPLGLAVRQNPVEAAEWNTAAAQGNDAGAQGRAGYQYATGFGMTADLKSAEHWFAAAAAQGNVAGMLGLGMLHAGSYGGARDETKAVEWL